VIKLKQFTLEVGPENKNKTSSLKKENTNETLDASSVN
jgi:hypothetical protein